jgi:hypothetical protein
MRTAGLAEVVGDRAVQVIAHPHDQRLQQWTRDTTSTVKRGKQGRPDGPTHTLQSRRRRQNRDIAAIDKSRGCCQGVWPRACATPSRDGWLAQPNRHNLPAYQRGWSATADIHQQESARRDACAVTAACSKQLDSYGCHAGSRAPWVRGDHAIASQHTSRDHQSGSGPARPGLHAGMSAGSKKQTQRKRKQETRAETDIPAHGMIGSRNIA